MSHSQFSLLKTKRFFPLFVTQFLGAFNDNVFKNALIILITYFAADKLEMDSRILVTAAAGLFILPFFLFSALAGQLVDAHEKSWFIRRIKMAEIILMLLAAIGFYAESVPMLMSVLFLMGVQSAFFGPVKYSILPDLLKEKELIGANALVEAGTFLAILLGTIIGGILILKSGGTIIISVIIITMSILGFISSLFVPKVAAADKGLKINYNLFTETLKIVKQTYQQKEVFLSILGISWFWLVGFIFLSQFPIFGKDVIGGDESVVTLLLTVFSVGIAFGSLLCNRLLKGKISGIYVPLGALGMTISIFLLWFVSRFIVPAETLIGVSEMLQSPANLAVLTSMLFIAIFGGIYIVPLYAIMQSRAKPSHRSRVIAANNIINALFMVLGAILTMLMLKLNMQIVDIFLVVGLGNIPVAIFVRRMVKNRIKINKGV